MKKVDKIKQYYKPKLNTKLQDYQMLGWESKESQYIRFDMFASGLELEDRSILDVGCGLGNLLDYFNEKGISVKYTGVDILEEMISLAKIRHPGAEFYCTDIFKANFFEKNSFDAVYASGIFNIDLGNNREFLANALDTMLALSRRYVCFNLLHHLSPGREDGYCYFSPEEAKEIVKSLPVKVTDIKIKEGYLNNDFTVICGK